MKNLTATLAITSVLVAGAGTAQADLLGDEVSIRIRVPNISNFDQTLTTTVTADASDALVFTNNDSLEFTVDPFPNGFVITNTGGGLAMSTGGFFEISDLDFSEPVVISEVTYTHNWFFVNADTSFTLDSASVDFTANSSFSSGRVMTVSIATEEAFRDTCNGDGGDQLSCTPCPCDNHAPVGTIGGCLNQSGSSARLIAIGSPSITAPGNDDLRFQMTGGNPSALAVLTSGDNVAPTNMANLCFGLESGIQSQFLDGLRCPVGNTQRHGGRVMDTSGDVGLFNNGWGGIDGPAPSIADQGGFVAGQTRYFQVFYRADVSLGCGTGQNTTQAVGLTFQP